MSLRGGTTKQSPHASCILTAGDCFATLAMTDIIILYRYTHTPHPPDNHTT